LRDFVIVMIEYEDTSACRSVGSFMRRWLLCLTLILTACAPAAESEQPLSPAMIRGALVGSTMIGYENGRQIYIYFAANGTATRYTDTAEFGQWRVEEDKGLCLSWHAEGERCMPVYQVHTGRYRLGDTEYNVYRRGFGDYGAGPLR
jgi:hypothetical protein